MTPAAFLLLLVALTLGAIVADRVSRRRRATRLAALAAELGWQYSRRDRFDVGGRLSAASSTGRVYARDLLYRRDANGFTYVATIDRADAAGRWARRLVALDEPTGSDLRRTSDEPAATEVAALAEQYLRAASSHEA